MSDSENVKAFFMREISEHRDTFDAENLRDFVDVYLDAEQKPNSGVITGTRLLHTWLPIYGDYISGSSYCTCWICVLEERILQVIGDLYQAGGETTSTTLVWALLFLIKYPHIQDKCRAEIKEVSHAWQRWHSLPTSMLT